MGKLSNIEISTDLLIDIIDGLIGTIPGVDTQTKADIKVLEENNRPVIMIKCKATKEILNLFQLALSIQEFVYFKISNDFDAVDAIVNVEIE